MEKINMKFTLTITNSMVYPIDEKFLHIPLEKKINPFLKNSLFYENKEIELNSLDDLIKLMKTIGCNEMVISISDKNQYPVLEIVNDYRE